MSETTPETHHCAPWEVFEDEFGIQIVMSEPHGICTIRNDLGVTDLDRKTAAFIVRACARHRDLLLTLTAASHALKSYAHGNASPELAAEIAAACDAALALARKED